MTDNAPDRRAGGPDLENRLSPDATVPVISSGDLLRGGREVLIEHRGELYRLRVTRNGKLILHK